MPQIAIWRKWLARNGCFCVLCYRDSQQTVIAAQQAGLPKPEVVPWVKIFGPTRDLNPVNPATAPLYWSTTRRLFEKHIREVHPDRYEMVFGAKP